MKDLHEMRKGELIRLCENLRNENEYLQDKVDRLNDCYCEMENKYADLVNSLDENPAISDLNWFKFQLQIDGLMTPQLESFLDYYLKFHNGGDH